MADRNELLTGIADHIGVLERWKRGTPEWWNRQQAGPGHVNESKAEGEERTRPMEPVTEPTLIYHGLVEDAPQVTEPRPDTFANLDSSLGERLVTHHPARTISEVNPDL
jgi:hypothetical protein